MDPELVRAVVGRFGFGLNADPQAVAEILKRTDLNGAYSVPATPEEVPLIKHQLLMQEYNHEALQGPSSSTGAPARPAADPSYPGYPELAGPLGKLIGPGFAGSWPTHVGAGSVAIAVAGPVDQAAVRALFPPDATLEFKAVRFSYRELIDRANALNAQITPDRHLGPAYLGRGRVGPDAMLNGLDVGMGDNADAARDCAFRLFVGDIPVSIRHGITDKIAQPLN